MGELSSNQLLLLLIEDIQEAWSICKPWMRKNLVCGESLWDVDEQNLADKVFEVFREVLSSTEVQVVIIGLQWVVVVQCFKWNISKYHRPQTNPARPHISWRTKVAVLANYLRCNVDGCATLLEKNLVLVLNRPRNTEVSNFYAAVAIEQNVLQFYVPVDYQVAMQIGDAVNDLAKDVLALLLR